MGGLAEDVRKSAPPRATGTVPGKRSPLGCSRLRSGRAATGFTTAVTPWRRGPAGGQLTAADWSVPVVSTDALDTLSPVRPRGPRGPGQGRPWIEGSLG